MPTATPQTYTCWRCATEFTAQPEQGELDMIAAEGRTQMPIKATCPNCGERIKLDYDIPQE